MVGLVEGGGGGLGVAHLKIDARVARRLLVQLRSAVGDGGVETDVGRQRVDIELDQLGGVARLRQRLGNDADDRLADIAHPPRRQ